jgi:ATP-dependent Clp protease ATP-binding subunit ClpA
MARITGEVRAAVLRAIQEQAPALGSPTVEAEHLLLALAADRAGPAGRLLAEVGLDPDGLRAALDHETERSLAAVGVRLADFALPDPPRAPRRPPKLATSAKTALERAVRVAAAHGDRHVAGAHLLLGRRARRARDGAARPRRRRRRPGRAGDAGRAAHRLGAIPHCTDPVPPRELPP